MSPRHQELVNRVQDIERAHPDWTAREIAAELEVLAPVETGRWRDATPNAGARLRQIQRWRRGGAAAGPVGVLRLPFPYLWPVGEHQRHGFEATFTPRATTQRGTPTVFLYNCSQEVVRDVRVRLARREVAYEPVLLPGSFSEIHWQRNESVRQAALAAKPNDVLRHRLVVDFVLAKGSKRARLEGELTMDVSEGWTSFTSEDGREKELQ